MPPREGLDCDVVIVGGGPGGGALARLLAQLSYSVVLLESASAIREQYRAELIQPSSLAPLRAAGVVGRLRAMARHVEGMEVFGKRRRLFRVDYSELSEGTTLMSIPIHETRRVLLEKDVPPGMTVRMGAKVNGLIKEGDAIRGVTYRDSAGEQARVRARLVIGADGRNSVVRKSAGIEAEEKKYDVQIITMNAHCEDDWLNHLRLHVHDKRFMALAPATDGDVRVAWAIPTGHFNELRKQPIGDLVDELVAHEAYVADWVKQVDAWDKVHLQPLNTAFAREWARDGLLLVGDAAHAVSPFGGQGLNMALHDALIASPIIAEALSANDVPPAAILGRLMEMRAGAARTILKGGDLALTVFGPKFPQPVRETAMGFGGKVRGPNRFMLPNLALGTSGVRRQLAEADERYTALLDKPVTVSS
ncbi:MAG TPA: FAD-dependent monooxygenase [Trebonia sp.]|nr:FAD-dependent monooxygenase [Trebonia sp.]